MCQLPLNKPHNGRLAAVFPKVTHEEFLSRELEYTVGPDRGEIQFNTVSFWVKNVLPSGKWPIQVVEIMYLDRWKIHARMGRLKDSEELHSDEQSADRLSFTAAIYICLHYQQYKVAASDPRLVVELG